MVEVSTSGQPGHAGHAIKERQRPEFVTYVNNFVKGMVWTTFYVKYRSSLSTTSISKRHESTSTCNTQLQLSEAHLVRHTRREEVESWDTSLQDLSEFAVLM